MSFPVVMIIFKVYCISLGWFVFHPLGISYNGYSLMLYGIVSIPCCVDGVFLALSMSLVTVTTSEHVSSFPVTSLIESPSNIIMSRENIYPTIRDYSLYSRTTSICVLICLLVEPFIISCSISYNLL